MALDPTATAARVAELLNLSPSDVDVQHAVFAAFAFVSVHTGMSDPGAALPPFPEDPIAEQGMVGFSRAIYLDALASRGSAVALGDTVVDTTYSPEDLYRHWHHYFDHLAVSWGIA